MFVRTSGSSPGLSQVRVLSLSPHSKTIPLQAFRAGPHMAVHGPEPQVNRVFWQAVLP